MLYYLLFIIIGYLIGSILFAPLFGQLIQKKDIIEGTKDLNPGTANAFMQGGIVCGILTLIGDMGKGFLPVFLCLQLRDTALAAPLLKIDQKIWGEVPEWVAIIGMTFVLLAPVLGHIFPLYRHFQGGKGIATTFGCLLGFAPNLFPALILAFFFILFSLVIRITPHFYRTIATYLCAMGIFFIWGETTEQKLGFFLISVVVCLRMHMSGEHRETCKVMLLWMH